MARVRDLWFVEVKDPNDPDKKIKRKTGRHPDRGGSKDAKRWLACWIDPDGKEKTKAFAVKEKAKSYGATKEADVERGEYIAPDAGKELIGPLGKKWLRLRDVGATTLPKYEGAFRLHVEPAFGHRQVQAVRPSEVLEWLRELGKKRGPGTQFVAYTILAGIFDLAVADGMRKDNPVKSPIVPVPKQEHKERKPWPVERIWLVSDHHAEPYRLIPTLGAGLGLREGEALALGEDDFDFEAETVEIGRQIVKIGGLWVFKAPKYGRVRTTPLPSGVARAVKAHIEAYPPRPYALPWMPERGPAEEERAVKLLFRWHGDDRRTHDQHVRTMAYDQGVWKPALVKAGIIPPRAKNSNGRFVYVESREDGTHALRHYYATTLMDAGVSLAGVMDFLGHSRRGVGVPVTLGTYGHVTPETFEQARNAIDRSLFRLRAVQDQISSGTGPEQAVSQ
ncbi:tyrosine-type recombinase/integrase [Actinomadura sp. HBU206391]|uniref:tyrosine-type recombinase/integrase n=1 Tax=Actinomadura sp. HBU206391 TaxID=2731692 RepID=UPI00164F62A9|nr:tyrosine-type recombinase/integrase [Actinomadura sp. HBU206391]MBC6462619.1 tyrosine-type recombinase/integrase [Actinomadura sp. HBU206391]